MFLLIIISQKIYSQVPSYIPTNGLVGYWPFSGNANDQSGNNLNGSVTGASLAADRFGNLGKAYAFLNGNQFITLPAPPSNTFTNTMSYSLWYKEVSNTDYVNIFNTTNNKALVLNPNATGIRANDGNSFYVQGNSPMLSVNGWKHLCVVYQGQVITIYINGNLVTSSTTGFSTTIQYLSTQSVVGSTYLMGGQYPFSGLIDDIAIYNRALNQQEITNLFNGVTYNDTCNAVSGSLVNGLKAYYPFCGNANDQSGNGLNGTVNGATLTTDRFGNANSAYNFNGINNFISCLPLPISGSSPRSITFWYKQTGTITTGNTAFSWGAATQGNRFDCGVSSGVSVGAAFSAKFFSYNATPTNWNMYTIVLPSMTNPSVNDILVYQNGVLLTNVLTNSSINVLTPINTTANEPLLFGKNNNYTDQAHLLGSLDDIGIWNRALTQQEIMQLYNQNQCINTISVTDTLIINVGQLSYTAPVTFANNITIFPNPASTQININFNNITDLAGGSIKIINSLGQQVATTPITATSTNSTMSLNTWGGAGLYFVQILNTQGQIVDIKKIVLQ